MHLNTTTNGFGQLKLEFKWFADGVFVTAASANYPQLLWAQLAKVGGVSIDEVLARLTRTVSRENEHWPRYAVPRLLRNPGVLRGIGVASATGPVPYAFKLAGGETA